MVFNGTDQQVSIPTAASLSLGSDFTVEAWVKPGTTTQPTNARIVSKFDGTTINYLMAYSGTDGRMRFLVDCGVRTTAFSTTLITNTSSWYHLVGVKQGNTLKMIVNGTEEGTATCTGAAGTNSAAVSIASSAGSAAYYNGTIDEVKIFNRALTPNEIKAEYAAGSTGIPAGLAFANDLIAGAPQNVDAQAVVQTDAPGYNLAISQNQNLTSGGSTIPAVTNGGTIASPTAWSNGTTKGLGFTLTGTNATALPGKWNSGASYAAVPGSATTFYSRSGYTAGAKDTLDIRYRLDVSASQTAGSYANTVTYTGTMVP